MAVRIGDTLKQINNADFPIVEAMDVAFESGDTLQELYDSGALSGGGSGTSYIELSEEEYFALSDEQRASEVEYRTYDTGRIFKRGVEYGKETDISGKQDDLNKIKFTMRRNGVNEPRYCLIGKSDLNQTILMNEPYIFEGVFGSNTSSDKKSIITLSVSFKNGADKDNIFRGYADCADGFQYVDLVVTVDEENMAYAYVDFKQESSLATGSIRVPSINTEYYMDLETEFVLVDSMQGTELCRMSDYAKIIANIDDATASTDTTWSSKKTSDEIATKQDKGCIAGITDANDAIGENGVNIFGMSALSANLPLSRTGIIRSYTTISNNYIRVNQEYSTIDNSPQNGGTYKRYGSSDDGGVTFTWSNWNFVASLDDSTTAALKTWSSSKINSDLSYKTNFNVTSMTELGFTKDSYVSVKDFWNKLVSRFGTNGTIRFSWMDTNRAYLGTSNNNVVINGGTLIYTTYGSPAEWRDFSAIYVGSYNNVVFHIRCAMTDNNDANTVWSITSLLSPINDSSTSETSTWSSSKIASEINPTIDISKVFSNGTLNIATLCTTYGAGRYVIVGQGTAGNGSVTIDIWTLASNAISYIVNVTYSNKTSNTFIGLTYENPTVNFETNYLSACNHIAKVCTLA